MPRGRWLHPRRPHLLCFTPILQFLTVCYGIHGPYSSMYYLWSFSSELFTCRRVFHAPRNGWFVPSPRTLMDQKSLTTLKMDDENSTSPLACGWCSHRWGFHLVPSARRAVSHSSLASGGTWGQVRARNWNWNPQNNSGEFGVNSGWQWLMVKSGYLKIQPPSRHAKHFSVGPFPGYFLDHLQLPMAQ